MVDGPREALARLAAAEPALAGYHRVHAVRAHLLEQAGDREAARACYRRAAELTLSVPERQLPPRPRRPMLSGYSVFARSVVTEFRFGGGRR